MYTKEHKVNISSQRNTAVNERIPQQTFSYMFIVTLDSELIIHACTDIVGSAHRWIEHIPRWSSLLLYTVVIDAEEKSDALPPLNLMQSVSPQLHTFGMHPHCV